MSTSLAGRTARRLLGGALCAALPAAAQEPAIVAYAPPLAFGGVFVDPPSAAGQGFLLRPAEALDVTGLTFFDPATRPTTGPAAATSYRVWVMSLTQTSFETFVGATLAEATVDAASATRTAPSGPAGTFRTTALASPVTLAAGGLYGVFAAALDGGFPLYGAGQIFPPLAPGVVGWIADASALGGQAVRTDATSLTGGSFTFVRAVPEPSAALLLAPALVAVGWVARRRRAARPTSTSPVPTLAHVAGSGTTDAARPVSR